MFDIPLKFIYIEQIVYSTEQYDTSTTSFYIFYWLFLSYGIF